MRVRSQRRRHRASPRPGETPRRSARRIRASPAGSSPSPRPRLRSVRLCPTPWRRGRREGRRLRSCHPRACRQGWCEPPGVSGVSPLASVRRRCKCVRRDRTERRPSRIRAAPTGGGPGGRTAQRPATRTREPRATRAARAAAMLTGDGVASPRQRGGEPHRDAGGIDQTIRSRTRLTAHARRAWAVGYVLVAPMHLDRAGELTPSPCSIRSHRMLGTQRACSVDNVLTTRVW